MNLFRRVVRKAKQLAINLLECHQDLRHGTHVAPRIVEGVRLQTIITPVPERTLSRIACQAAQLSDRYLAHQYDLLGSGWMDLMCPANDSAARYGSSELPRWARSYADSLWEMISPTYRHLDWHQDYKSGYRWSGRTWFKDIQFGRIKGVDIKAPWELSRMQHFAQFAVAYAACIHDKPVKGAAYQREFQDQILDFIASNPPRFGPNWACTMDVAIRIANWLIAFDLFSGHGSKFDPQFVSTLKQSAYAHGLHIIGNLESHDGLKANHYLANIAGLVFVAAYLEGTAELDNWLAFAVSELISEVGKQFQTDGSNFEASTSYHRLAAELVVYSTALILGLPEDRQSKLKNHPLLRDNHGTGTNGIFPRWYVERLEAIAHFTAWTAAPDGNDLQIGDNDNGRFFKFHPALRQEEDSLVENFLDHGHLISAIEALFEPGTETHAWLDGEIVASLTQGRRLEQGALGISAIRLADRSHHPPEHISLLANMERREFPDFGLYVYRSAYLYLAFRCGSIGQLGRGGHAHNDMLSIELSIAGKPILVDSGSYTYTAAPDKRNYFRSTWQHNTLALRSYEQNTWTKGIRGLFALENSAQAQLITFDDDEVAGYHQGFGPNHERKIELAHNFIRGTDTLPLPVEKTISFHLAPGLIPDREDDGIKLVVDSMTIVFSSSTGEWNVVDSEYSPSYGILLSNKCITLTSASDAIEWTIRLERQ